MDNIRSFLKNCIFLDELYQRKLSKLSKKAFPKKAFFKKVWKNSEQL
jgi:hypothetical protein